MNADARELLDPQASRLLRHAALFDEIRESSPAVETLMALGLLRLRDEQRPAEGYLITPLGADVVHGAGPFRIAADDGSDGSTAAPVP